MKITKVISESGLVNEELLLLACLCAIHLIMGSRKMTDGKRGKEKVHPNGACMIFGET